MFRSEIPCLFVLGALIREREFCPKPPSKVAGHLIKGFGLASIAVLFVPVFFMRSSGEGRRTRRRRCVNGMICLFMALLMFVGPETVYALHVEHMMYQALAASGLGTVVPEETVYSYTGADGDNGNLTKITKPNGGATEEYSYDAENRLLATKITPDPATYPDLRTEIAYTYDADGIRIAKTVQEYNASNTLTSEDIVTYLVDKNRDYAQVLEERDGSDALKVRYTYGHDLISQDRGGTKSYFHYDGQMSTRQLTNSTGTVSDKYTYDAFGRLIDTGATNATVNKYLYTGEQLDLHDDDTAPAVQSVDTTSQYYLRARYYQPGTGRFMSRDAYGGSTQDPVSLHKYLYANADPVNNIDPSGMFTMITFSASSFLRSGIRALAVKAAKDAVAGALTSVITSFILHGTQYSPEGYMADIAQGAILGVLTGGTTRLAGVAVKKALTVIGHSLGLRLLIQFLANPFTISALYDALVVAWHIKQMEGNWPSGKRMAIIIALTLILNWGIGSVGKSFGNVLESSDSMLASIAQKRASGGGWPQGLAQMTTNQRQMRLAIAHFASTFRTQWSRVPTLANLVSQITTALSEVKVFQED